MNLDILVYSSIILGFLPYIIFSLVMTQLVANEISNRLNKDKSRFAWLPIYGTFVLSKLTLNSYKYATQLIIATFVKIVSIIGTTYALLFGVLTYPGGGETTFFITFIISLILSIITLVFKYKIYRAVAEVFGYGRVISILSLFFAPIIWINFIFSKNENKYI